MAFSAQIGHIVYWA